jgi:hypothetical protein
MPYIIHVDSRKRNSGSHSEFDYQLPNPIQVPKCRCFVDSVHIANVFPMIHVANRFIYIQEISTTNVSTKRKVGLTAGQIFDGTTLATEVATQLNTGTTLTASSYSCSFDTTTGRLTISNTTPSPADFSIWPAEHLKHGLWNPLNLASIPAYIEGDDCCDVIGFAGPYLITGNSTTPITGAGHINVMPYHALFLHSSLGLQSDCIGPDDSQSIIRKIVLDTAPGSMVNDFHSLPYDYVSVQPSQIRNLSFRLADYRGRTVDLQHQGFSFSLLFVPEEEF